VIKIDTFFTPKPFVLSFPYKMATASSAAAIPFVGSWKLYFHDPANPNWGEEDYKLIAPIRSWEEYWLVTNAISDVKFQGGGFFLVKDGFPPRWEHYSNRRGGAYQVQVNLTEPYRRIFNVYCISMILGSVTRDPANTIVCTTIALKRGYYIIKEWNTDAERYHEIEDIHNYVSSTSSMRYDPHTTKI